MKKNEEKVNTLIKKKKLIDFLSSIGIKRICPEALDFLRKKFKQDILNFCLVLKQELDISGKRTLKVENIQQAIKEVESQENLDY